MMQASGPTSEADYRRRLALWLAMVFSIVMYYVVIQRVTPANPQENLTLVYALLGGSGGLVVTSFVMKRRMLARADLPNMARRRAADIIAIVLCEAAALLGVVAWFITAWSRSYIFFGVGLAGILLHYPKREG
ncbi:MAG TPA: hypothetical protein VEU96_18570 [Bryobacteraceae bacterium]|nr:hypothetical protein [Bryobacteraceae bacterium]